MYLKIHNKGWVYFIISLIITIIIFPLFFILGIIFLIITIYIFYFFRDPIRSIPFEDVIISPADGIVTYIGNNETFNDIDGEDKYIKISIFLSIFNVHVNRIPCNGYVSKIKYISGKFINATSNKSSLDNERNIILIENNNKEKFIIVQIAGLIARRIVCELMEKQEVRKGDRYGIIKFGSRVDLYMPVNYKPLVSLGQLVVGGETIIANPNNIKEITKSIKN